LINLFCEQSQAKEDPDRRGEEIHSANSFGKVSVKCYNGNAIASAAS